MVRSAKLVLAAAFLSLANATPSAGVVLFSQTPGTDNALGSDQNAPLVAYTLISIGSASTIHNITWRGLYSLGLGSGPSVSDPFRIGLFQNVGGAVGAGIADVQTLGAVNRTDTGLVAFGRSIFQYSFDLNLAVAAGTYWLTVLNNVPPNTDALWTWAGGNVSGHTDRQGFSFGEGSLLFSDSGRYVIVEGDVTGVAPSVIPIPAALPLFATGLGALGILGWWRKKKGQQSLRDFEGQ
jgi:hypothetical protein